MPWANFNLFLTSFEIQKNKGVDNSRNRRPTSIPENLDLLVNNNFLC